MTFRHELKFVLDQQSYSLLRMRVRSVLKKDPYTDDSGQYTVRSLYFDDFQNSAYNEKDMSILKRQKYRIRLYNQSTSVIHLERKIKSNNYVAKEQADLSSAEVIALMEGDYDFLRNSPSRLKQIFYYECLSKLLRPRVMVDYEREPYIMDAGTVRVTFDKNIRAGMEALNLFNSRMAMVEALPDDQIVMEVKFTGFLPTIVRDILPSSVAQHASVSKYILCCDKAIYQRKTDI